MSQPYLHVYRAASGQWSGKILEEVAGIAGCLHPSEVLEEAHDRYPDIEDLPRDAPPPGGTVETVEVNADAFTELIEAAADAAKLLEGIAPHHPQTAALRAALAQVEGGSA